MATFKREIRQEMVMALEEQESYGGADSSDADDGGRTLTQELWIICTAWIIGAILLGIAFVAFSDVFAGIVG